MKDLLFWAVACSLLALLFLFCYIVSHMVIIAILGAFLFGLSIGLFIAFFYTRGKKALEMDRRLALLSHDHD